MFRKLFPPQMQKLTELTMLVLMLWHAPIPISHRHDHEQEGSGQQLAEHLQNHHEGEVAESDWHLHWVYPGDGYTGLGGEEPVAAAKPMLSCGSFSMPEASSDYCVEILVLELPALFGNRTPLEVLSFQTVGLLHSRQSLPELFGVMLL